MGGWHTPRCFLLPSRLYVPRSEPNRGCSFSRFQAGFWAIRFENERLLPVNGLSHILDLVDFGRLVALPTIKTLFFLLLSSRNLTCI
jgi:hypothetical protein